MTRNAATSRRTKQTNPATELAASVVEPLPGRSAQLQPAFSTQALFWRPHHAAMSPALGQIPFLFWLTETVRPRTIVQFGLGDGVLYMGLCQGCERLGDSAICLGIQAEEPLLPPVMRAQHDARYSDFSELRQGDIRTIAPRFAGEIDLLVLNQALDSEALTRLRSKWMPLLSDRAVILLCDPDKIFSDEAAREIVFPEQDRSIVFGPVSTGGHAVEVILYGKEQAERLIALASQRPGEHAYLVTRQVFNRLGQGIEAIQTAEDIRKERDSLRASLQAIEKNLEAQKTELGNQRAEAKAARDAEAAEASRQAELVARLYDVEQLLSEQSRQVTLLNTEKASLEDRIKALEAQAATREAEHKAALGVAEHNAKEALAALRAEMDSVGTAKSALDAQFGALKTQHEEHVKQAADRQAAIEGLRKEKADAEAHLDALRTRHEEQLAQAAEWQAQIEALRSEKAAAEAELAEARNEREDQARQAALMTEKIQAEAAEWQARMEALRSEKAAVGAEMAEARALHEEQARQAALMTEKHEAESAAQQAEIEALRSERAAVEVLLSEAQAAHEERIEDIVLLAEKHRTEAARQQAETETLRSEKAALEAELGKARSGQEEYARQAAHLADSSKAEAARKQAEIETLRSEKAALEAELGKARSGATRQQAEIEALRVEKATIEAQLKEARTAHEERVEDIALLTEKYRDDLKRLKAEVDPLRATKAALEAQLADMQKSKDGRIRELENEIEKRQQQLIRREAEFDATTAATQQTLADLHRMAGEELGRVIKALLPAGKNGLLAKKASLPEQAKLLVDRGIVDPDWYMQHHVDVAAAGMDPAVHYLLHGAEEGRHPRGRLDEATRAAR